MGKVTILEQTTKTPLTFMGQCAGIAYDSDTSDPVKNYNRGYNCVRDGHGRMLEFCDIYFELDGYSVRVIREFMRHVADGLTVIQRSTRYCNEGDFEYYIPPEVNKDWDGARDRYICMMDEIKNAYKDLTEIYGVSKEDAANILPLGMNTKLAVKHNARTMMTMAEQRLCSRTYIEYQQLMKDFIEALENYSEEWSVLCKFIMKCKCDKVGWCEESHSCGKYPKRQDVLVLKKNSF